VAMQLPAIPGTVALVVWFWFEVALRPRGARSLQAGRQDRGSTAVLVVAYVVAVSVPALLPAGLAPVPVACRWLGVALAAGGLFLRAWAMRALGASYTRTLWTDDAQGLVTAGPCRVLRHPGYAGSLAVWVGYAATRGEAAVLLAVLLLLSGAYAWRIRAEEAMLADRFGAGYRAYAARTKRLVPGLW
jgi:protein-S-isoprenylcysteine O-methyltransferase Ste14